MRIGWGFHIGPFWVGETLWSSRRRRRSSRPRREARALDAKALEARYAWLRRQQATGDTEELQRETRAR